MSSRNLPTPEQIEALLEFTNTIEAYKNQRKTTSVKWREIATKLNTMEGCIKNVKQWQKVWAVRKRQTRRSIDKLRKHKARRQRSGPLSLTGWKSKVAAIMGYEVEANKARAMARASSLIKASTVTSTQSEENQDSEMRSLGNKESADNEEDEGVGEEDCENDESGEASRWSAMEKLLRFEEEREQNDIRRNEELAGIRAALVELCGLVRRLIDTHFKE